MTQRDAARAVQRTNAGVKEIVAFLQANSRKIADSGVWAWLVRFAGVLIQLQLNVIADVFLNVLRQFCHGTTGNRGPGPWFLEHFPFASDQPFCAYVQCSSDPNDMP